MDMLAFLVIGFSYALSAALQPGPLQAFFLSKVSQQGWKRTLPAAAAPLLSDGPIALTAIFLLQLLPAGFRDYLGLAGGFLLLYFAWSGFQTFRSIRAGESSEGSVGSAPGTIFQAALVNLLNPNPYLGWSLVMGPAVLEAWSIAPQMALALLLSFYLTMIAASMLVIYLMGRALLLGGTAREVISLISTLLLAGLAVYFLYRSGSALLGG